MKCRCFVQALLPFICEALLTQGSLNGGVNSAEIGGLCNVICLFYLVWIAMSVLIIFWYSILVYMGESGKRYRKFLESVAEKDGHIERTAS